MSESNATDGRKLSPGEVDDVLNDREEKFGELCRYCGYREAHHPVSYADPAKDGILCEEVKPRDD